MILNKKCMYCISNFTFGLSGYENINLRNAALTVFRCAKSNALTFFSPTVVAMWGTIKGLIFNPGGYIDPSQCKKGSRCFISLRLNRVDGVFCKPGSIIRLGLEKCDPTYFCRVHIIFWGRRRWQPTYIKNNLNSSRFFMQFLFSGNIIYWIY